MTLARCKIVFQKNISKQYCIRRLIYSETGLWPPTCTYDSDYCCLISHLKLIEKHWKPLVTQKWHELSKNRRKANTRYILSMFPYPSGSLHLGHVRIYTMGDIISRYNQLNGYNIVNPMGWDSFGLPAENAAIERSLNPKEWTNMNISNMRHQFDSIALNFEWREATSD
ncbi:putative leucine--tRNA ligase-like protein, partial [Leptotrombidium deliense]